MSDGLSGRKENERLFIAHDKTRGSSRGSVLHLPLLELELRDDYVE